MMSAVGANSLLPQEIEGRDIVALWGIAREGVDSADQPIDELRGR
jgi:hypothetical protein